LVRRTPTAHSHPDMNKYFISEINYVWPDNKREVMGLTIEPFYKRQVKAVKEDKAFYRLIALVDVIRVGKVREVKHAIKELKKSFSGEIKN
jgi:hypothetical protein